MQMKPSSMCSNAVSCRPAMRRPYLASIGRNDLCCRGSEGRRASRHHERSVHMDTSGGARRNAGGEAPRGVRLRSTAMILIFDVGAPLAAYNGLRSAGLTAVTALLLSGVFPAAGVAIAVVRNRRLDVVGALVLAGIAVGTIFGLVSHS